MKRAVLLLALAACVDKSAAGDPSPVDRGAVEARLLDTVPPIPYRVDARFRAPGGGEIVYLGHDAPNLEVGPGDKLRITHVWRVIEPPGPGWTIFTHLQGPKGDFQKADETEMRRGHPSADWKAGQVILDEQEIVLSREWKSPLAVVRLGLHPVGAHRIDERMEIVTAEQADAVDRALMVASIRVDLSKAPPPPGTLILKKAPSPIVVDGKADEPGWRTAAVQTAFSVAEGCPELVDSTTGKLTWDDQYLYLFVSAEDSDVYSPYTKHDDTLWKADVVEIFVDADGNRRGYVELQVNPRNVVFDTWFERGRPNRDDSWDSQMQTAVVVRGTLDDREDGDAGWDVEIAIPWAAAKGRDEGMKINTPPQPGDVWRLNVVRGEAPAEGGNTAASWNRITCEDWHALDRMLNVQFGAP